MIIKYIDNEDMLRIEELNLRVESNKEGSTFFNDANYTSIIDFLSEYFIDMQLKEKNGNSKIFTAKDLMECVVPKAKTPVILLGGDYAVSKGLASKIIDIICYEIKIGSKLLDMDLIFKQVKTRKTR